MRANLSVTILKMTENRVVVHADGTQSNEQEFQWTSVQKGIVLSSFFFGYVASQVRKKSSKI